MHGRTNAVGEAGELSGLGWDSYSFRIHRVSAKPKFASKGSAIAVNAPVPITGFSALFANAVNGTSISSNGIFARGTIGDLYYIVKSVAPVTGYTVYFGSIKTKLTLRSGTQMYQKTSSSGNLTAVDAWYYNRDSEWESLNK